MADHIRIRKASGRWTVRSDGGVIAESQAAFELSEDGYDPVIYFPRGDVAMAMLDPSDKATQCPHKGEAAYFNVVNRSETLADAAWCYPDPDPMVADIKDCIAFYTSDRIKVERV